MAAKTDTWWGVLDEEHRLAWTFSPFEGVGPLKFGMTHQQAKAAVAVFMESGIEQGFADNIRLAEFWADPPLGAPFFGPSVTAYYDPSLGLSAIAVNALRGPQVTFAGMPLVGQVPSVLEGLFIRYLETHEKQLAYSQTGDLCAEHLGLVLRAQRAGDLVLSRPVMVAEAWADRCGDVTEGFIPREEWKTFEW
ncbi:hypothetical protein [Streptomyces aureus]|uniref:hypothetical protein n=1 Tax=Streptomyces aureus TaxID=193461 RepID=UPI0036C699DB